MQILDGNYSDKEIELMSRKVKAVYNGYSDITGLCDLMASKIANGCVIGWFQGRMEFGPRALGNRSILADPRNPEMQRKLNLKIKYREGFRPFAPSVLEEYIGDYFEMDCESPYMLMVSPVVESLKKMLPDNYFELSLWERLYIIRSELQSITHLDFSARIQSVHKDTNPRYWELINSFRKQTGCGLLVNTSFNVRGEPIVCTPLDAYKCFMSTEIDYLVINDFVFSKVDQPDWQNKAKWLENFKMD